MVSEEDVSVVAGVESDRLLARKSLLRVELPFKALGRPRNRDPHSQERVVGIHGSQRADLLHVVRASSRNSPGFEDTFERLEPAETIVTELRGKSPRVQIEPVRLDIDAHAEPRKHLHGLFTHEVRVGDAGARAPNRRRRVDLFVAVQHRVDGTIAYRVGGELKP